MHRLHLDPVTFLGKRTAACSAFVLYLNTPVSLLMPPCIRQQLNQAAIKLAEEQDKERLVQERAAAKQVRDAAAYAAWQKQHGKPKQPKKPRAPRPRKQPQQQQPGAETSAAAGGVAAAAAAVGALNDAELVDFLTDGAGSSSSQARPASAAAAAEAPKARPGIQIKHRGTIKPLIVKQQPAVTAAAAAEEEQPGTPSTQLSGEQANRFKTQQHMQERLSYMCAGACGACIHKKRT